MAQNTLTSMITLEHFDTVNEHLCKSSNYLEVHDVNGKFVEDKFINMILQLQINDQCNNEFDCSSCNKHPYYTYFPVIKDGITYFTLGYANDSYTEVSNIKTLKEIVKRHKYLIHQELSNFKFKYQFDIVEEINGIRIKVDIMTM